MIMEEIKYKITTQFKTFCCYGILIPYFDLQYSRKSFFLTSIRLRSAILLTESHSLALCPDFSQYIKRRGLGFVSQNGVLF